MNLKSRLFKKPWQHKDPDNRASAVRESDDPELKTALPELAQHDESAVVRLAALERLNTEPFWLDARLRESDPAIVSAADQFLLRAVTRTEGGPLAETRLEWFAGIDTPDHVRKLATSAKDTALRGAALAKIQAQGFLGDCYVSEPDPELAASILERIDQHSTLERLAQRLKKTSKQRAKAVADRLNTLRAADGSLDPDQIAADELVARIEDLARGKGKENRATALQSLQQEWQKLTRPPASLARRFEGAVTIIEAGMNRPAPLPKTPDDESAEDDSQPNATPALAEAAESIRQTLRQARRSLKPQELLGNWDRAWNSLGSPGPADQALKEDMLPILRELQAQMQQKTQSAETSKPAEPARPVRDFDAELDAIATTLEEGNIARANEAIRSARSEIDRLPNRERPKAATGRLHRMEGRLKEMRDYQHWSHNKHRDELIEQIEQLAESGQHPDAISATLKQAREEWQRLETLEILPGDRKQHAAPPGQWRRFQAACKTAFETAKPYFEKRQELQDETLEQLDAFIDQGMELAEQEEADPRKLTPVMRKARQAIRRLDDLPPRTRGKAAGRLRGLMDAISARLDSAFEKVELNKRRLITEARALAHEKDLKVAIDKAKALQAEWQKAGSGRRKIEQKLWDEFRQPIDPLFDQLKGERDEQKQADKEAVAAMEVLCEQAEALAKLDDSELEDAQGRMQGLTSEWLAQNQRPGRLVQRFDKAQARFSERIEQLHERARQQAEQALASRAAQIQQLWEKRLAGEPIAVDSAGAGDSRPESELEQKLVAVTDRIADPESSVDALTETTEQNAELARQVVVEMEFLAGMDSPADDQKRRMDYQVKRLASRLGDRSQQPDLATELASLQHRWLTSLPHPPKIHSELAKRFEKCQTVVQKMTGHS